ALASTSCAVRASSRTCCSAIVARASGVFGKARDVDLGWQPEPPALPDWREANVLEGRALPPPFARHYRFRPTGPAPFAGGAEAVVEGWVELARPAERIGAPELAGLIDAYWPSFFARSRAPRPAATVAFMLHLTPAAARLDPSEPLFFRSRGHQVAEGYLFERRELWSPRGELVALNPQTFCIIR
ncbi:MAG TPA: thioesterase family protein, partial [Polyangiaceae bacterium LLY-WYZ-15_(1-7)]|nr:thioesterase family protein [Polyangiaceae bacterium LLY-WYZ-15_(1-7)]